MRLNFRISSSLSRMANSTNKNDVQKDYDDKFNTFNYLKYYMVQNHNLSPTIPYKYWLLPTVKVLEQFADRLMGKQRVLEFGGGPVLWPSFLLAQYFHEIWFCDYTPSNLIAVQNFLDRTADAHNWIPFFEYLLKPSDDLQQRDDKLRQALRNGRLFRCDVNSDNLLIEQENGIMQFDMIFSRLCLEAACTTYLMYKRTIKRLADMLKPDGMILMNAGRNETFYMIGNEKFWVLALNEENITQAFIDGGLSKPHFIIEQVSYENVKNPTSDCDARMVFYAFKSNTNS
ncbi:unnamed protein product [Didymodactylos carnosus]|uniref:Uncharacterized protein n=1 Tax=Didymodactylos carnosus TaxID=1234261 RepID=A0A814RA89_9BILA|nr:unnamed protein product [Didymodactylos carnosus]CAF1260270.1 unnamed protein product [Didymodactylos carnosus]CAF3893446.1 unnamed protein product [Didymodactylos carnosus]CAF4066997.1 unnamed protein product [Didymodactylos carnosus]